MEKNRSNTYNQLKKIFSFHIKVDDLMPASKEERSQQNIMHESTTFFKDGLRRLFKNKVSLVCIVVLIVIILSVIFIPMFWPYSYEEQLINQRGQSSDASYANIKMFSYGTTEKIKIAKYKAGLDKTEGPNGEVEYIVTEQGIMYKYVSESDDKYTLLISLEELAKSSGYNSKKGTIEYDFDSAEPNWVCWRYVSGEAVWSEVLNISELDAATYSVYIQAVEDGATITYQINEDSGTLDFGVPNEINPSETDYYEIANINELPSSLQDAIGSSSKDNITFKVEEGSFKWSVAVSKVWTKLVKISLIGNIAGEKVFPHLFGTDSLGRDYFIRVIYGARVSLSVGLFASIIVLIIGTIYGSISGYFGGKVDLVMMRIVDMIYALPDMLIIILLSVVLNTLLGDSISGTIFGSLGANMISIFIVFGLLYWVSMARLIRGQILSLKEQEYVLAAQSIGSSPARIIKKHLLPNCISVIIISTALQIPSAIFTESFLSFLGLGVAEPMPSLGSLASDALSGVYSYTYRLIIPAVFICLIVLSLNLLGDGLRDAFDPKLRN